MKKPFEKSRADKEMKGGPMEGSMKEEKMDAPQMMTGKQKKATKMRMKGMPLGMMKGK